MSITKKCCLPLIAILISYLPIFIYADHLQRANFEIDLINDEISEDFILEVNGANSLTGFARSFEQEVDNPRKLKILGTYLAGKSIQHEIIEEGPISAIIIGEPNKELIPGSYNYQLNLNISNLLKAGEKNTVLNYSLNSAYWILSTREITAKVILPREVSPTQIKHYGYTKLDQEVDQSTVVSKFVLNKHSLEIHYQAKRELAPGEEMFIYAEFPNLDQEDRETEEIASEVTDEVRPEPATHPNRILGKAVNVAEASSIDQTAIISNDNSAAKISDQNPTEIRFGKKITVGDDNQKIGKSVRVE